MIEKLIIGLLTLPAFILPCAKAPQQNGDADVNGLYTKITLTIDGGNGQVWATAKNEFTLFPSKVQVYVEIYYSYNRADDYTQMTLAQRNYIEDLDQGKTIQAYGSTNGEARYWMGRVEYKMDNKDWSSGTTNIVRSDGNGNLLG